MAITGAVAAPRIILGCLTHAILAVCIAVRGIGVLTRFADALLDMRRMTIPRAVAAPRIVLSRLTHAILAVCIAVRSIGVSTRLADTSLDGCQQYIVVSAFAGPGVRTVFEADAASDAAIHTVVEILDVVEWDTVIG